MTDVDMVAAALLRLAAIALVVVGLDATLSFFLQSGFLAQGPAALETFAYLGAAVGLVDNLIWAVTGSGLGQL
jgi:hypothetical protein